MPQKPLPACDWPARAWLVCQKAARVRQIPASKTRTSHPGMTAQLPASSLFPLLLVGVMCTNPKPPEKVKMDCYKDVKGTIYEYDALPLNGKEHIQFKQYAGKHVLFVNVATYCGLTAQYPGLNALQDELKPWGLVVLGFPCNQFGNQEPGENSEILPGLKYVRPGRGYVPNFQLFEKGDVNGKTEQKVFSFLKLSCPHPSEVLGSFRHISWEPVKVHDIRWNFEKFLVGPNGVPVMRWFHQAPISTVRLDILEYLKQLKTK
ncbi:epididymal secretory glutathione peroxidase isoform X1 [Herpailurus yagouaroundi]|uniref:epididymal secretory glutathione peroxidase isoform X1 n=2 Tax=Herpailurus yagouaroundi TaxID=1608482 RepID=UPI001AD64999|nr:epididymal secretory glutathione peroxidase isoform X1 [Puma yagouaroundi]